MIIENIYGIILLLIGLISVLIENYVDKILIKKAHSFDSEKDSLINSFLSINQDLLQIQTSINNINFEIKPYNIINFETKRCKNCGATKHSYICEYCGT